MALAAARRNSLRAARDIPASAGAARRVCRTGVEASACAIVLLMSHAPIFKPLRGCALIAGQKFLSENQQPLGAIMPSVKQIAKMATAAGRDAPADDPSFSVFHRDDLAGRKISFQRGDARDQQAGMAFDQRFAGVGVDRYLSVYGGSEGQPAFFAAMRAPGRKTVPASSPRKILSTIPGLLPLAITTS